MRMYSLNFYVNLLSFICIGLIASTLLTKAMPLKDRLPKRSRDSSPTELEMQLTTRLITDGEKRQNKRDNESGEENTITSDPDTAAVSMRRGSESTVDKRFVQLLPSPSTPIPVLISPPSQEEIDDLIESSNGMLSLSELAELQESYFLHNSSTNDVRSKSLGDKTCREMDRKLKHAAPKEGSVYCPWTYKCNYSEQRYPRYLIQAECLQNYCHSGCNNTGSGEHGSPQGHCTPITVVVQILKPKIVGSYGSGDDIEWSKHNKRIRLGCKCSSQY